MLSSRQQHCLQGIGIRRWVEHSITTEPLATETIALPPTTLETPLDSWDTVNHAILGCAACELARNCTQKVPGVGAQHADVMIIGEGPGHDEDVKGEPFVGRSGQLLDKMLASIGLSYSQVFTTNIVKCRPPNNRDPHVNEVQTCNRFLRAQIQLIKPEVILSVGRISAQSLLNSSQPVGHLIKTIHQLPDSKIPVKVTYHPAYLLRNPSAKAIVWQDLKTLYRILHP
ncbi:MAG: uracil-DNA glycosylase [Gammaproteobacteria bacterium]|nr:uracil-DNA glycosylase [Gammaproteobacteria bacterium]